MQRWALILSAYSYSIEYRPTHCHSNADALSRLPLKEASNSEKSRDLVSRFNLVKMSALPLTHVQLRKATRTDPILSRVLEFTKRGWPNAVAQELNPFMRRATELTVEAECLLWGNRVIIPSVYRKQMLDELHVSHPGVCRMKALARSHIWWPGMDQEIETLVKACRACEEAKTSPLTVPLHPWVWPESPWRRIHIDFAGPLFNKMYMLVVDAHSKWPEIWEMKSTSAKHTVAILQHLFSLYGYPEQVVSDNGPQFVAREFTDFLVSCGVKHYRSAPYHPATNGAVERLVKTFKAAMKTGKRDGVQDNEVLTQFLMRYRSTPHTVTGTTPADLFLKRPLRTRFQLLKPSYSGVVRSQQERQKTYHDRRGKEQSFDVGQQVAAIDYRKNHDKWAKGIISRVLGTRLYLVQLDDGTMCRRHAEQLRPSVQAAETAESVSGNCGDSAVIEESWGDHEHMDNEGVEGESEESERVRQSERQNTDSVSDTQPVERRYPTRDRRPPCRPGFISY